jgi:hypothetical protein
MHVVAKLFSNGNVAFDQVSTSMRCFEHVINLIVEVFLWGQSADAVVQEVGVLHDDIDTTQKLHLWQKQGPLGHLRNILTRILHFAQRQDCFTEMAKQVVPDASAYIPLIGSIILWHGDVDAIERAFIVQTHLDEFEFTAIWEYQQKIKSNDTQLLQMMCWILASFWRKTFLRITGRT